MRRRNKTTTDFWVPLGDTPTGQADAGAAIIGDRLYLIGGYGNTATDPLDTVSVFLSINNTWGRATSAPYRAWGGACAALDVFIYYFGGCGAGRRASRYDTVTLDWEFIRPLPVDLDNSQGHAIVADVKNSRIFIVGESGGNGSRELWVYYPDTDYYYRMKDLPEPLGWSAVSLWGESIYVLGGYNGETEQPTGSAYQYDIRSDTWKSLKRIPGQPRYGMMREATAIKAFIPIIEGLDKTFFYDSAYFYNTADGKYYRGADTTMKRDGVSGGVIDGTIYLAGGRNRLRLPQGLTRLERYKPDLDSLTPA